MNRLKDKPWNRHSHQEEHDDEAWIVSYADMMTLLFGFFFILYSFSTPDEQKFTQMGEGLATALKVQDGSDNKVAGIDAQISGEQRQIRALHLLVAMLNLGNSMDEALNKIEKQSEKTKAGQAIDELIADRLDRDKSSIISAIRGGRDPQEDVVDMILPSTSLFPAGGYSLTPTAERKIRKLATELSFAENLNTIEVVGHTDSSAPGGAMNNFTLSSLRAGAIAEALLRGGLDKKKVVIRGMADLAPLVPERDQQGRLLPDNMAKNRRVHIILKKKVYEAP